MLALESNYAFFGRSPNYSDIFSFARENDSAQYAWKPPIIEVIF